MKKVLAVGDVIFGMDVIGAKLTNAGISYTILVAKDKSFMEKVILTAPDVILVREFFPYKNCQELYIAIKENLPKPVDFVFCINLIDIEAEQEFFDSISCIVIPCPNIPITADALSSLLDIDIRSPLS